MKKELFFLFAVVLMLIITGCGKTESESTNEMVDNQKNQLESNEQMTKEEDQVSFAEESEQEREMENKTLVVYFSATGTTKKLAEYAADILDADTYEILAEEPYTDADLDYYSGGRADQEQDNPSVRPVITGSVENMDEYDTIILGYPIWHGQAPRIISTFLESYDFSGKTIIPFCTSHSSGIGPSTDDLHKLCSAQTTWEDGERFSAETSKEEIRRWLENFYGE